MKTRFVVRVALAGALWTLEAGDRIVVFYGQGHVRLLNQCIDEAPGVRRVDPLHYLSGT